MCYLQIVIYLFIYFIYLFWICSPDHENIVDKSKPQVWLMGWVKESVAFKFTKKQISVGRSHARAYSTLLVITSILHFINFLTSNHSDNHMLLIPIEKLKMGVILSGKQAKPTLSTKLRQLSLWALINVMNCNYI